MPTDVLYGSQTELRIGIMADQDTDPDTWWPLPFISFSASPQRERIDRPKLGVARHNPLDPIKPIPGFLRLVGDLVVDADARHLALFLHCLLGAPATTGSGPYNHVFASGAVTPRYAAIQMKTGANAVRVYRGVTLAAISLQGSGEATRNYDVQLALRGLGRERVSDWLAGDVEDMPAESVMHRAVFRVDGTAAEHTLDSSWSWDRQLAEDAFMSTTAQLSGLRPNGGVHTGQARFRALAASFDTLEENDTVTAFDIQMLGVTAGHQILLAHPQALLAAPPLSVSGPGLVERTVSWVSHQTSGQPASRIMITNDVAAYA